MVKYVDFFFFILIAEIVYNDDEYVVWIWLHSYLLSLRVYTFWFLPRIIREGWIKTKTETNINYTTFTEQSVL